MRRLNFRQYLEMGVRQAPQQKVGLIGADDPTLMGQPSDNTVVMPQRAAAPAQRPPVPQRAPAAAAMQAAGPKPTGVIGHNDPTVMGGKPAAGPEEYLPAANMPQGKGGPALTAQNDPMLQLYHRAIGKMGGQTEQGRNKAALTPFTDQQVVQMFGAEAERFKKIGLLQKMRDGSWRLSPELSRRYGMLKLR